MNEVEWVPLALPSDSLYFVFTVFRQNQIKVLFVNTGETTLVETWEVAACNT